MSFSSSESGNSKKPADDKLFLHWGSFVGGVLGLLLTLFAGHWLTNLVLVGIAGATIGALIDRSRR